MARGCRTAGDARYGVDRAEETRRAIEARATAEAEERRRGRAPAGLEQVGGGRGSGSTTSWRAWSALLAALYGTDGIAALMERHAGGAAVGGGAAAAGAGGGRRDGDDASATATAAAPPTVTANEADGASASITLDIAGFRSLLRRTLKISPRVLSDRDVDIFLIALDEDGSGDIDASELEAFLARWDDEDEGAATATEDKAETVEDESLNEDCRDSMGAGSGEGEKRRPRRVLYKGQWCKGVREGKGCEIFSDGSRFDGDLKAGLRHGHGVMTWPRVHDGAPPLAREFTEEELLRDDLEVEDEAGEDGNDKERGGGEEEGGRS